MNFKTETQLLQELEMVWGMLRAERTQRPSGRVSQTFSDELSSIILDKQLAEGDRLQRVLARLQDATNDLPPPSGLFRHEDICGDEVGPSVPWYSADQMRADRAQRAAPGVQGGDDDKALRLADKLNSLCVAEFAWPYLNDAATELRHLHKLVATQQTPPAAVAQHSAQPVAETIKFTDTSTASAVEKTRRYLTKMADKRQGNSYFYDDGYPHVSIADDAAAALSVFEQLAAAQPVTLEPLPLTEQQERDAFEAYWYDTYHAGSISVGPLGFYANKEVRRAWDAWQARAAHGIKPAGEKGGES